MKQKQNKIFKKTDNGLVAECENYDIVIKYDADSTDRELIKIIPKTGEIILNSDQILDIVREQFRQKEMALALSTTNINFIPVIEAAIPISYIANKDIKEGERVQFFAPFTLPVGIVRAMEAYNLCVSRGTEIAMVPKEAYEETAQLLEDESKKFVEQFWGPQIKQLEELRKASGVTKEV